MIPYRTRLPESLINKKIEITGQIVSIPNNNNLFSHFLFKIERPKMTVRLNWYGEHTTLHVGDVWKFHVKLKPMHSLHNFNTFDTERTLVMEGIRATGYVLPGQPAMCLNRNSWNRPIDHIRERLQLKIIDVVKNPFLSAFLIALCIGSRVDMSSSQWEIFQNTGTSHLIAVSGLHISLVSGAIYFLINLGYRQFTRASLRIPTPQVSTVGALLGAVLYSVLAGMSLPTQRALIMISAFLLGTLFHKNILPGRRWILAFSIMVFTQPYALYSASFWLSFMAVFSLCYGCLGREHFSRWKQALYTQKMITICLLPITLFFFKKVSLITFVANLIAIPWIGFVILPCALVGSVLNLIGFAFSNTVFVITAALLSPLWLLLEHLSRLPAILMYQPVLSYKVLLCSLAGVVILFAPPGWPLRWLGIFWILPLFFPETHKPLTGDFRMTLLDVGQGLSVVIETAKHTLVYDAGPKSAYGFDAGSQILIPYLRERGLKHIDRLIVSHGDNDHRGGSEALLRDFPVNSVLSSVPNLFSQTQAHACFYGQKWTWDGVDFAVLSPLRISDSKGNNRSCVVKIATREHSLLLTGDIEKSQEKWLVAHHKDLLMSSVLIAPHHGSRTSSTSNFVQAVRAQAVLFSVGYYNRYGLPNKHVLERYDHSRALIMSTSINGAIRINFTAGRKFQIESAYQPNYFSL